MSPPFKMKKPSLKILRNGLRVVLVPCEAESVAVGVFIASGSRHETAKTAGISHFIEHMLFKGTQTRKPVDISRAIEGRGGNFNACTGEESTCYFAHLPCEHLAEAVEILSDMYLHALIPDGEFEREKQVIVEEIKMYADEPDAVAMENLQRALFPASQLGAPVAGTPESLAPLKPADLRRYVKTHYLSSNTVIVIAGHFDEAKALACVEQSFKEMRSSRRVLLSDRALKGRPKAMISVDREINQSQLALGYRLFGRHDSRKYAAVVMDAILGRGMSSRLFQEVREKRGLSYDISSRIQFFSDAGLFTVTAGLDRTKMEKTLQTIDRELERIRTKRVSAAELQRTKDFLTGNFRLGHERVTSKMFFYGPMVMATNRLGSPEEEVAKIRAVTAADVLAVAQSILTPANRCVSWVVPR